MVLLNLAIIDCGVGNLRSVQKMLETLGAPAAITQTAEDLTRAQALVLPGVGAFGAAMRKLEDQRLVPIIREQVIGARKPLLGICLGLQLLGRSSDENPGIPGLGLIPGEVRRLDVAQHHDSLGRRLTLPHIGWNSVTPSPAVMLFDGVPAGADFYFVHSYHFVPDDPTAIEATCSYGERFVCAVRQDNIFAVQFHPEKSQKNGQAVLRNALKWMAAQVPAGQPT